MAQGEAVPVHGLVLAAASPYLAHLISSSPEGDPHDVIILDSVQTNQVAVLHLYVPIITVRQDQFKIQLS
jgi:hypothetical protein